MASEPDVGCYRAFGLTIGSAFPLPELRRAVGDGEPDVRIRRGDVEPVDDVGRPADEGRYVDVEPGRCTITYEDFGSVRVEDGRSITVDLVRDELGDSKVFRRLLQGQVVAVLLHQRGLLVLHASAVAVDGAAAIFLGPSGAGKTTTAAACYAGGHALLDDDVAAIELRDGRPVVRAGVPELKLSPDGAAELGVDVRPSPDFDAGSPKEYHRIESEERAVDVPVAGCYRLVEGPQPVVEPVEPRDRLVALISNTFTVGLLETTGTSSRNLSQCSALADAVPICDLARPDALGRVGEVADLVARDVAASRPDGDGPATSTDARIATHDERR